MNDRPEKRPAPCQEFAAKDKMPISISTKKCSGNKLSEQLNKTNFIQFTFCCSILL